MVGSPSTWVLAMVAAAVVVRGAAAHAQEATPAPTAREAQNAAEARRHFEEGMEHYQAARYREAIASFERAAEHVPSADLWYNIARAHEQLGEHERAAEAYRRYLRDRVEPPDAEAVEARIAQLEAQAEAERRREERPANGQLVVRSDRDGAEVRVDGEHVATTPVPAPLTLSPDHHRLDVSDEDHVPFRAQLRIDPGMTTEAHVALSPTTEYRSVPRRRVFTWVLTGLSAASLAAGVGLGVHAVQVKNDGDLASARDWARYSDYATAGVITFGVGAVIAYFLEGRASETVRIERQRAP